MANVSSVENLSVLSALLREQAGETNVWMINIARGVQQMDRLRFEAMNPGFLLGVIKD